MIKAILARTENGVIGNAGQMPWSLPNDLRFFKQKTLRHVLLMGRKTWQSIGCKPLPERDNWVLSRSLQSTQSMTVFAELSAALQAYSALADRELFVVGGAEIYRLTLPHWQELYLTRIHTRIEPADSFFQDWKAQAPWRLTWSESHPADERHAFAYTFEHWQRHK